MGIFSKKRKIEQVDRISIFDTDYSLDKSNWYQVYSACLGRAMAVQKACAEQVVKNQNWNVDFGEGTLAFGKKKYPVQFIGSEANSDDSWLWGYDNINGFADSLLKLADEVKEIGERWNLEPLKTPGFPLDDTLNGHNLSMVACGISKENYCYYRGPHEGGAILMAFSGVPDSVFAPVDAAKFSRIVMECIGQFQVEHKIFVESFLMWNGTKYEWQENQIMAHFSRDVCIAFEQVEEWMRISEIKMI